MPPFACCSAFDRTLVLVKPDGIRRGLVGRVLQRFEDRQFKIVAMEMVHPTREQLETHYEEHKERVFFAPLIEYMLSGPIVVLVLEGPNVVPIVRTMIGTTNPALASPGTIRGDFCTTTDQNLIHASESPEAAAREIDLWLANANTCSKYE